MPDEGWVPIANNAARDSRLSWRSRGLLLELLSYPDGWETNVDKLVDMSATADDSHTEGRYAMRAAMLELVKYGYVRRLRCREHGRWVTKVSVKDAAHTTSDLPPSVDRTPVAPPPVDRSSLQRRTMKTDTKNLTKKTREPVAPKEVDTSDQDQSDWPDVTVPGAGWDHSAWALASYDAE